jgi:DNA-binding MarR family transcriptional regulator
MVVYIDIISMYSISMSDLAAVPLTGLVWRLSMRWRSAIDRQLAPLGLTHAGYALIVPLLGLHRQGRSPTQRELADLTGLEPLYVSKLARTLQTAGLLERRPDPHDSRAVRLTLTQTGLRVGAQAMSQVRGLQESLTESLGGLASPATRALIESLTTLLAAAGGVPSTTGES